MKKLISIWIIIGIFFSKQIFAQPPKLELSNTTVLIISSITVVSIVTFGLLMHEKVEQKRRKREQAQKGSNKEPKMRPKTKEEMKKELLEMREND